MEFLKTVCGDSPIYFRTFSPLKGKSGHSLSDESKLKEENKTRGIYFVVNSGGQADADITQYNACFCEIDSLPIPLQHKLYDDSPLPTSIRVETLRSVHAYWLLEPGATEDEWRRAQQGLIEYFKADPAIKNPSRVLRVPGYDHIHKKTGARTPVTCTQLTDTRYPIETILRIFKPTKLTNLLNAIPGVNVNISLTAEIASLCAHKIAMADAVRIANALCPGKEDEVALAARNIYSKDGKSRRAHNDVCAADLLPPPPVKWLWRRMIPIGMFGGIIGMPGAGKTFFALKVIADYTHGQVCHEPLCEPRKVLIFTSADDPKSRTMQRRLLSLGADMKYIQFSMDKNIFTDGVDFFREKMEKWKPGIVMFDPLHVDSKIDANNGQAIREFLENLGDVFDEYGETSFLPIQHLNKKQDLPGIHRISGSHVIGAIARWTLEVVKIQGAPNLRGVRVVKQTEGIEKEGLTGFSIEGTDDLPKVDWSDREDLIEHKEGEKISKLDFAVGFITPMMEENPRPVHEEAKRRARNAGINSSTFRDALRASGIVTKRVYGSEGVDHCTLEWEEGEI